MVFKTLRSKLAQSVSNILLGRDGKPMTVSVMFAFDDCSRLITKFGDYELRQAKTIVIVWEKIDGSLEVETTQNLDPVRAVGMLSLAQSVMGESGDQKS